MAYDFSVEMKWMKKVSSNKWTQTNVEKKNLQVKKYSTYVFTLKYLEKIVVQQEGQFWKYKFAIIQEY